MEFALRWMRPPQVVRVERRSLLSPVCVQQARADIRSHSVHLGPCVESSWLAAVRPWIDSLPVGHYGNVHELSPFASLSQDPQILAVLRAYFGAEPELLECSIVVHEPVAGARGAKGNGLFHFDFGGWRSLNVFVYLTDVTEGTAAHRVIRGSHRGKRASDLYRTSLSNEEVSQRFCERELVVTGPAGTLFFENTEAVHRRGPIGGRRVILNLLYASHRGFFSHGRRQRTWADYVAGASGEHLGITATGDTSRAHVAGVL